MLQRLVAAIAPLRCPQGSDIDENRTLTVDANSIWLAYKQPKRHGGTSGRLPSTCPRTLHGRGRITGHRTGNVGPNDALQPPEPPVATIGKQQVMPVVRVPAKPIGERQYFVRLKGDCPEPTAVNLHDPLRPDAMRGDDRLPPVQSLEPVNFARHSIVSAVPPEN